MQTWQIVIGAILGIVTALIVIYISFTARQKGPIFSNTYIWLSKEQKKKADKKAEYHTVTVIFCGLAMFFLMDTIYVLTLSEIPLVLGFCFIGFDIIYAVVHYLTKNNK